MMKRLLRNIWNSEKTIMASKDYDSWSKQQLIDKIKELETAVPEKQARKLETSSETDQQPPKKKKKTFDFSKHSSRFVAIKFAYLGWPFNGLAFQYEPTPLPTVEQVILNALTTAKLIKEADPGSCNFSRCGRTDKGVSAMNQVISLNIRSSLTEEEQKLKENDNKEIPYLIILNSLLPPEIRVTAICFRPPPDFDARFSCDYRHYRYLINKEGLDIDRMKEAASSYLGLHDFRNFCKIDGCKQISNYRRQVYHADIIPYDNEYVMFDLKGSAFLWHQVRYMVGVLLAVGQHHEDISIVKNLLDVEKYPTKPNFEMANDIPLILYDCIFPEMEWLRPVDFTNTFHKSVKEYGKMNAFVVDSQVKAHVARIMKDFVVSDADKLKKSPGSGFINIGDGRGRGFKTYVPILEREFGEHFEVVNERFLERRKARKEEQNNAV